MVNDNVGSVLQALVANNARVGKQAIVGYRAATHYLVKRFNVGGYYAKAFDRISDGAEKVLDSVDERASGLIGKAAARVSKIGNERAARFVGLAGQASLPPLKLARDVSAWVATRTETRLAPHAVKRRAAKKTRATAKAKRKTSRA